MTHTHFARRSHARFTASVPTPDRPTVTLKGLNPSHHHDQGTHARHVQQDILGEIATHPKPSRFRLFVLVQPRIPQPASQLPFENATSLSMVPRHAWSGGSGRQWTALDAISSHSVRMNWSMAPWSVRMPDSDSCAWRPGRSERNQNLKCICNRA